MNHWAFTFDRQGDLAIYNNGERLTGCVEENGGNDGFLPYMVRGESFIGKSN